MYEIEFCVIHIAFYLQENLKSYKRTVLKSEKYY